MMDDSKYEIVMNPVWCGHGCPTPNRSLQNSPGTECRALLVAQYCCHLVLGSNLPNQSKGWGGQYIGLTFYETQVQQCQDPHSQYPLGMACQSYIQIFCDPIILIPAVRIKMANLTFTKFPIALFFNGHEEKFLK